VQTPEPVAANPQESTVAALYVYRDGIYAGLSNVDIWDEERDARLYNGPHPVVAHPPCKVWCLMANCRPEIVKGDDGGCFEAALRAVRLYGGVLEHPAHSGEVDQRWYGHEANKPTWLYYYGDFAPDPLRPGRAPAGEKTVGRSWGQGRDKKRSATPPAFRDVLLRLARLAAVREDQLPDPEASWALR
jgi:hypothetical protein